MARNRFPSDWSSSSLWGSGHPAGEGGGCLAGCLPRRCLAWFGLGGPSRSRRKVRVKTDFLRVYAASRSVNRRLPSGLDTTPLLSKTIYLVRHAEALHNVQEKHAQEEVRKMGGDAADMEEARKSVLHDPSFLDASLSPGGQEQVCQASDDFAALLAETHYPLPETVFVSPLERALQTATLLFPDHGDIRAMEFLREKRTGMPCDERKPAAELAAAFPSVDFADVLEVDAAGCDGHVFRAEMRECNDAVAERGDLLLSFLRRRCEDAIAVVTHKGFLRELSNGASGSVEGGELPSVFGNAEVRVCEVTWSASGTSSMRARSLQRAVLQPLMVVDSHRSISESSEAQALPRGISMPLGTPQGNGLFMAVGASREHDSSAAAAEAWHIMQARLGGAPTFAVVFCNCAVDGAAVAEALRAPAGAAVVVGGSSTRGVLTRDGPGRVGVMGFRGLAWRHGVGSATGASGSSAYRAGAEAAALAMADAATAPDFLFLCSAPGHEEAVLEGVHSVCGDAPVFGGSTADDSIASGGPNGMWWQLHGSLAGWGLHSDGVVIAALWLYRDASVSCFLSHCFVPRSMKGTITKAKGRVLSEINGRPAALVLDEWMGGALRHQLEGGLIQMQASLSPIAVLHHDQLRLIHMKAIARDGQVECYAAVTQGEVRCLQSKASDVSGALHALACAAIKRANFRIKGAIVDISAGYVSSVANMQVLCDSLPVELQEFMCFCSFGEQGMINGVATHGNLMINVALFG